MKKAIVFPILILSALVVSYGITNLFFRDSEIDSLRHIECVFTMSLDVQPEYVAYNDTLNFTLKIQNLTSETVTWKRFNELCSFCSGGSVKNKDDIEVYLLTWPNTPWEQRFSRIPPKGYVNINETITARSLMEQLKKKTSAPGPATCDEIKKLSGASGLNFTIKPLSPSKVLVYENTVPLKFSASMLAKKCHCGVCSNDAVVFLDLSPQPGREGKEWQFLVNGKEKEIDFPSSMAGKYVACRDFLIASEYEVITLDHAHEVINLKKNKKTPRKI